MSINYVICAAGAGSRFSMMSSKPKPALVLKGKSMLEWSLASLPILPKDQIILVTQKKHQLKAHFVEKLKNQFPFNEIHFVEIDNLTRGQLETALLAENVCNPEFSLAIFNCDTYFQSSNFLRLTRDESIDGIIPCSLEPGNAWSFCAVDTDAKSKELCLTEIAEKKRISDYASVGLYYFKETKLFFSAAKEYVTSFKSDEEIYVAPFYQIYLQSKKKIVVDAVDLFLPMGSMPQLLDYWGVDANMFQKMNPRGVLVMDLDNTITIEEPNVSYADKKPNLAVIEKIHQYKEQGYKIIIFTARRMKTHGNDEAAILADVASTTLDWLKKHKVPHDGIKFGKPYAENAFYVDDRAIRPSEFIHLSTDKIEELLQ